jgi:glycosyltransferase involved in cell wall biosynthesis
MQTIRIHIGYKPVEKPWGGANNFIRALREELARTGRYSFIESMDVDCDILFLNQLGMGPGRGTMRFERVRRYREGRVALSDRLRGRKRTTATRLVVRAVNLNSHVSNTGMRSRLFGRRADHQVLKLLNLADIVVFQSSYQRAVFTEQGYTGRRNLVIHNGADPAFWLTTVPIRPAGRLLRIAASTTSRRSLKRHDLIARLSEFPDVEVRHFGNWPEHIDPRRVQLHGMVAKEKMAEEYSRCDYLFHPAVNDMCPNAIFEAICSGLPVIYNSGPGSSTEIVGANGFALNEEDLRETVDRARASQLELREAVAHNRDYYTVQRATRQYREVFETMASQAPD